MPTFKYYDEIRTAQAATRADGIDLSLPFDLNDLGADSSWRRLSHAAFDWATKLAFRLFRRFRPIAKIGRLVLVSRRDDVLDVLRQPDLFEVPFGLEMTELAGGESFVLGLEGEEHAWQRQVIRDALRRDDLVALSDLARSTAESLVANACGRIDIMKDLFTRVSVEACCAYFGLAPADPDAFAEWTLAISALLFADPFGSPKTRALALKGAAGVRGVIDAALARFGAAAGEATLMSRFKLRQATEPRLTDAKIRAMLVGLATGLIPTTTLAAGRIFEELLRRPNVFRQAQEAAAANDKTKLKAFLFEAARLNPALSPGQWRYANADGVIAKGTSRETKVPAGSVILVGVASALVDETNQPDSFEFKADRPDSSFDLVFGWGAHDCLGKWLAMTLIVEIAAVLLSLPNLKPAAGYDGRIGWVGAFPRRLDFSFDHPRAPVGVAMPTIAIPFSVVAQSAEIKSEVEALGNPVRADIKAALDATGMIHFASISVLDFGDAAQPRPHIVIEINADGDEQSAIRAFASALQPWLATIVGRATQSKASLLEILLQHRLSLKTTPFGAIGLNFAGLGGLSVAEIERQSQLAEFSQEALRAYFETRLAPGGRALDALQFVRSLIGSDPRLKPMIDRDATGRLAELAKRGQVFAGDLLLPSRRQLPLMDWKPPSYAKALFDLLADPADLPVPKLVFAVSVLALASGSFLWLGYPHADNTWLEALFVVALASVALLAGFLEAGLIVCLVSAAAVAWLRLCETRDVPDDREPSLAAIRAAARVEDSLGYAQNHFASVSDLKRGFFRKLTLAGSLWVIKELVIRIYRPGFVVNLGTINFARWFRPPGAQKLVFFSNFDGSWHSYLEDFITIAHAGQSAAWSNAVGFPKTRYLVLDGAKDGDRFKRWVRCQQAPASFWYARFKSIAADVKRANALIHFGLARAEDESEARDWLSQFGSMPRPDATIEYAEVQSIVFRGFRGLPHAIFATIRFPKDRLRLGQWLKGLASGSGVDGLREPALELAFGDNPFFVENEQTAVAFAAFSSGGLERAGFPAGKVGDKSTSFPSAFNLGMAARSKILGDFGASSPPNWRWSDAEGGVDALLMILGKTPEACLERLATHERALGAESFEDKILSSPTAKGEGYEPFGFRDGLSQPVIKGTRRAGRGAPSADLMETGEFILGYKNNSGYFTPSPTVPEIFDVFDRLPALDAAPRLDVPRLDAPTSLRDFGRNGAFLAIRKLGLDIEGFHRQAQRHADELSARPRLAEVIGGPVSREWVEAKMMGRWQDGSSLLERRPGSEDRHGPYDKIDNKFDFGSDDPEGFGCPLGSHIRRSNPRGGLRPGDAQERTIVNRHRIIRRGRPYPRQADSNDEGLVFVAICADLERQFEFVQQSWINAPGFENLRDEPDPIAGAAEEDSRRSFTIPTPSGPMRLTGLQSFVEVKAGGYFFLPSLSALLFLADAAAQSAAVSTPSRTAKGGPG